MPNPVVLLKRSLVTAWWLCLWLPAMAQTQAAPVPKDVADRVLLKSFQRHYAIFLCPTGKGGTIVELREALEPHIAGFDPQDESLADTFQRAVYTAFPCPFPPYRPELKPATRQDLLGYWITPFESRRLRHGPESPLWKGMGNLPPVACEAVTLHDSGVHRVTQGLGNDPSNCPTRQRVEAAEAWPVVSTWEMRPAGRYVITRTDSTRVEEWEVVRVVTDFRLFNIDFRTGDLLAYLRREPGNDINATTTWRHLRRLP